MDTPALQFEKSADGRRYSGRADRQEVAFADVDPIGGDGLLIKHTEVPRAFEGRGYAGALVRYILEDARSQGRNVVPTCPYAAAYIARHPEYLGLVRESDRARVERLRPPRSS